MTMDSVGSGIKIRSKLPSLLSILKRIISRQKMPYVVRSIPLYWMRKGKFIRLDMAVRTEVCSLTCSWTLLDLWDMALTPLVSNQSRLEPSKARKSKESLQVVSSTLPSTHKANFTTSVMVNTAHSETERTKTTTSQLKTSTLTTWKHNKTSLSRKLSQAKVTQWH